MKKTVFKYGMIAGVLLAFFMAATLPFMDEKTNMEEGQWIGFAGMILAFATIFVAIIKYRNQKLDGRISFGKAFIIGLYISLIASGIYVISWMIISHFFVPDFMTNYTGSVIAGINENETLSQTQRMEQINQAEAFHEQYKNPVFKFLFTYVEVLPIGILVTLIAALFLKKK